MKYLPTTILFAFTFFTSYAQGGENSKATSKKERDKDDSTRHKYKIEIDLDAGMVKVPLKKNKPRKMKVGSFMYVSVKNLPKGFTVQAYVTFENGNMESGNLFSKVLGDNVDKIKANSTEATSQPKSKEADSTVEKLNVELKSKLKSENSSKPTTPATDSNKAGTIDDKFNVDIFNLPKMLEISDASSYLNDKNLKKSHSHIKAAEDVNWQKKLIKIANENIKTFSDKKDGIIKEYANEIDSLNNILVALNKPKYDKNLIGIQVHNTDYTKARIEIKDNAGKLVNVIPLNYNNMGGFKLDFSTGFFNSFYETFNYKIRPKDTTINGNTTAIDTLVRIDKISNGRNNISFGILAHAHWRITQSFDPAISTGFTYTPASKTLNYLVGLSALCGRQQRFVVTAGIAFNRIQQLEYLSTDKTYHTSVLNLASNLTYNSKLKGAAFIGVSYNLGSLSGSGSEIQVLY